MEDLLRLVKQLEVGARVAQPRLRYRLQQDRVGLLRSSHRLHGEGEHLWFEFDDGKGEPNQQILGALYAAGHLPSAARPPVMAAIRRAIGWTGRVDEGFIATLAGFGRGSNGHELPGFALADPIGWALQVLGFTAIEWSSDDHRRRGSVAARLNGNAPSRELVQKHFRDALMTAHPDHGGGSDDAAKRIADLTQARRILLGT